MFGVQFNIMWIPISMCLQSCSLLICLPRPILELNIASFSPNSVLLIRYEFERWLVYI
uniref:Uncharacterized protein n=1 Tax=Zea mays TaxID=4577 RepID=B4FZR4_MAIZE|nr:unknown [Zea mays]